jgi:hypothetical protein
MLIKAANLKLLKQLEYVFIGFDGLVRMEFIFDVRFHPHKTFIK